MSEPVAPIVITLTSDPETGRGGGEGLVYTAEVAASGREPDLRDFEVGVRRARPAVARSLGIPEDTEVIFRQQNGYVDGLRWSRQTSYYPRSLEARAPRLLDTSDIAPGDDRLPRAGRHQSGRVSGHDRVADPGRGGYGLFRPSSRRPRAGGRDPARRVRPERRPYPAHRHDVPGRPEPVRRQRRQRSAQRDGTRSSRTRVATRPSSPVAEVPVIHPGLGMADACSRPRLAAVYDAFECHSPRLTPGDSRFGAGLFMSARAVLAWRPAGRGMDVKVDPRRARRGSRPAQGRGSG